MTAEVSGAQIGVLIRISHCTDVKHVEQRTKGVG